MGGYVLRKRRIAPPLEKSFSKKTGPRRPDGGLIPKTVIQNSTGLPIFNTYDNDLRGTESTYSWRDGGEAEATQPAEILNTAREAAIDRRYDTGHEFWSEKRWLSLSHESVTLRSTTGAVVSGPLYPGGIAGVENISYSVPVINTNYYGNKAIAATAPTAPNANTAVTAAELIRERITMPGMAGYADWLKSRSTLARSLGSEWLNVQFGLAPVMSDAHKLFKSMSNMNKTIMQLIRDDGRPVRRRYSFPPTRTTTQDSFSPNLGEVHMIQNGSDISGGAWAGLYAPQSVSRRCSLTVTTNTYERYWFSGAYIYKIPVDDSIIGHFRRYEFFLNKLAGTRPTPEVLWELLPWSWLVDWFADVQSFMRATSLLHSDGLVLKYGYLMRTTVVSRSYTLGGFHFNNPKGYVNGTPITATQHIKRVERVRSTPFGFGLNPNAFSARQWSILAALGLSKSPRTLF